MKELRSPFYKLRALVLVTISCIILVSPLLVEAAGYPKKPVRIVVTYGAGGGTDVIFRAASSVIHQYWGQPLIIINKSTVPVGTASCRPTIPNPRCTRPTSPTPADRAITASRRPSASRCTGRGTSTPIRPGSCRPAKIATRPTPSGGWTRPTSDSR